MTDATDVSVSIIERKRKTYSFFINLTFIDGVNNSYKSYFPYFI